MNILKINFVDFWPNFVKNDNYFYHLLSQEFNVQIDDSDPDLLFFSVDYSRSNELSKFYNHRCKKIFYTGEGVEPNFDGPASIELPNYSIGKCDYSFTFEHINDRNYRLPLWVLFINWFGVPHSDARDVSFLTHLSDILDAPKFPKSKFCNFVFSNPSGERENILNAIQKYKKVDCAGNLRNNMPNGAKVKGRGDQKEKVLFLSDYKFTIAAENKKRNGYTTEKLFHALVSGGIPIYWGSESVNKDFNPERFINVEDFNSYDELLNEIIYLDQNDRAYKQKISKPIFADNKIPDFAKPKNVLKFFKDKIIQ